MTYVYIVGQFDGGGDTVATTDIDRLLELVRQNFVDPKSWPGWLESAALRLAELIETKKVVDTPGWYSLHSGYGGLALLVLPLS